MPNDHFIDFEGVAVGQVGELGLGSLSSSQLLLSSPGVAHSTPLREEALVLGAVATSGVIACSAEIG